MGVGAYSTGLGVDKWIKIALPCGIRGVLQETCQTIAVRSGDVSGLSLRL